MPRWQSWTEITDGKQTVGSWPQRPTDWSFAIVHTKLTSSLSFVAFGITKCQQSHGLLSYCQVDTAILAKVMSLQQKLAPLLEAKAKTWALFRFLFGWVVLDGLPKSLKPWCLMGVLVWFRMVCGVSVGFTAWHVSFFMECPSMTRLLPWKQVQPALQKEAGAFVGRNSLVACGSTTLPTRT